MKKFILASASPRRSDLLTMLGFPFEAVPSRVSETVDQDLSPADHVLEISGRKARAVAQQYPDALVLGADTVVALGNEILEKPADAEDAVRMLSHLSGKTHRVYTGLTFIDADRTLSEVAITDVTLRHIQPEEIRQYVATGDPLDKAGAYAAQGRAAVFIESVSGCFYNVVGLPLSIFWNMVGQMLEASPLTLISKTSSPTDMISPGRS